MRLLKFQDFLFELGDANVKAYDWKSLGYKSGFDYSGGGYKYSFQADDLDYYVFFQYRQEDDYSLSFGIGDFDVETQTNRGNQFRIMATVVDILFSFVEMMDPEYIRFAGSASGGETSFHDVTQRTKFYREYVKKHLPENYQMIDNENNTIIQKIII
jgi:hypothetical protein